LSRGEKRKIIFVVFLYITVYILIANILSVLLFYDIFKIIYWLYAEFVEKKKKYMTDYRRPYSILPAKLTI